MNTSNNGREKLPRPYTQERDPCTGKSQSFAILAKTGTARPKRRALVMMLSSTRLFSGSRHQLYTSLPQARLVATIRVAKHWMAVQTRTREAIVVAFSRELMTPEIALKIYFCISPVIGT